MRQRGFTLIELLVAAAVFAIMAAIAYSGLNGLIQSRSQLRENTTRLADIQRAGMIMQRDIMQARDRSIRDPYQGDLVPSMLGGGDGEYGLQFTRGGHSNPLSQQRSSLERVAYRVEDGKLIRYSWNYPDHAQDAVPMRAVLLEDVDRVTLRFLDQKGQWNDQWPRLARQTGTDFGLPAGIEVNIDLKDWGRITRVYEVAGS